jgi:hypothetical protein
MTTTKKSFSITEKQKGTRGKSKMNLAITAAVATNLTFEHWWLKVEKEKEKTTGRANSNIAVQAE